MVRRKITIERIEDNATRQVTFSKRRGGLFKKAHDLSVLCDAHVAIIVFSSNGKLFRFPNAMGMESILDRYEQYAEAEYECETYEDDNELVKDHDQYSHANTNNDQANIISSFTQRWEPFIVKTSGELEKLSLGDILQLEQYVEKSLRCVRAKKDDLLMEKIDEINEMVADKSKAEMLAGYKARDFKSQQHDGDGDDEDEDEENSDGGSPATAVQEKSYWSCSISYNSKGNRGNDDDAMQESIPLKFSCQDLNLLPAVNSDCHLSS